MIYWLGIHSVKKTSTTTFLYLEDVDTLDEVEIDDDVDTELDVETLKFKQCIVLLYLV